MAFLTSVGPIIITLISILAMAALNEELDKNAKRTLSHLFFFGMGTEGVFIFIYIAVIGACCCCHCVHHNDRYFILYLCISSSMIVWNSESPPHVIISIFAYNSLGALLCICCVGWFVKNRLCIFLGLSLAIAQILFCNLGPVIHKVHREHTRGNNTAVVVQLSDLHIGPTCRYRCTAEIVETALRVKKVDIFVITGDVVDGRVDAYSSAAEPLRRLHKRATTIMVIGNHDHMHGDIDNVVRLMESLGIIVLRNEAMYVKNLMIIGLDDIKPDISMISQTALADLILVHQPSVGASIQAKINKNALILAGHTHCGQMLPVIPVIWAANAAYFCGVYGNMYVSSGSGQWGPTMRFFFNRAEVAVHSL